MNKANNDKIENIKKLFELAEKYNKDVNIELSIYGDSSINIIKEAKIIYKKYFRIDYQKAEKSRWVKFHNAPKGKDYLSGNFDINIFYPR